MSINLWQIKRTCLIGGAIYGSLVADALTLGSHYEYDARVIKSAYGGTISEFMGPGEKMGGSTHGVGWGRRNYHPGENKLIIGLVLTVHSLH